MKRFFMAALCAILLFSAASCSKNGKDPAETDPAPTAPSTEEALPETIAKLAEDELLYTIDAKAGTAEEGPLSAMDSYQVYPIREKKDLDPFRRHFSDLSADEEAKYLADTEGKCIVIEITATSGFSYYGISSVMRAGGNISVFISSNEDEIPTPSHTFFLLYFSSETYQGEAIQIFFE